MKTPKKRVTLKTPKRNTKSTFKSNTQDEKIPKEKVVSKTKVDTKKNTDNKKSTDLKKNTDLKKSTDSKKNTDSKKSSVNNNHFLDDLNIEIENTESELISALQKENDFLRSTNLYVKFLGLDISQVNNKYVVKYSVDKENRFLHFELLPEDDMYVYSLVRSENLEELGILGDEISFEKEQVAKFFYKVMEIMISD